MEELFNFNAQMFNHLLNIHCSPKIQFSQPVRWHASHPYQRLNFYDQIQVSQVMGVYLALSKDWLERFDNIVEIGSYNGGLSSYVYDSKKESASFVSYDINPSINTAAQKRPYMDFRVADCFDEKTHEEIKGLIQKEGTTLMICDGGDKTREFNVFSDYLKSGDVIILHDYKDESQEALFMEAREYWQWPHLFECSYESVKEAVQRNGLEKFYYDKFLFYFWGCFIKK